MSRAGASLLALLALCTANPAAGGESRGMDVAARAFARFETGSDEVRFGALEFAGGLELSARAPEFGGFSAMRFSTPGGDFVGVADTGYWFFGRIARDGAGRPAGLEAFSMTPIMDGEGPVTRDKRFADAEGLEIHDGTAIVSFEREHRLVEYGLERPEMGPPRTRVDFLVPAYELRVNKGFETLARARDDGPLAGARIAITERSIDEAGNIFAAVLEGPARGVFTVARHDGFDITDGAFLPGGDLLLLERRYTPLTGVAMRMRRIAGEAIGPGRLADGDVVMEADMGQRIDNMEALDVWRGADGATMISVLSDDNRSFLQRTLYLEFRLVE